MQSAPKLRSGTASGVMLICTLTTSDTLKPGMAALLQFSDVKGVGFRGGWPWFPAR